MNKIYKIVWNRVKGCYVVASEHAKGYQTGSLRTRITKVSAGAVLAATIVMIGNVSTADAYETYYKPNGIYITGMSDGANNSVAPFTLGGVNKLFQPTGAYQGNVSYAEMDLYNYYNPYNDKAHDQNYAAYVYGAEHANGIGIGNKSQVVDTDNPLNITSAGIAVGDYARGIGGAAISLGHYSTAEGVGSVALGNAAKASGFNATAIARQSAATGAMSIAVGTVSAATGKGSVAVGPSATATGENAIAIGSVSMEIQKGKNGVPLTKYDGINNTMAEGKGSLAFGSNARTSANAEHSTAIGMKARTSAAKAVAVGYESKATAESAFAFGDRTQAGGAKSIAFGVDTMTATSAAQATVVGTSAAAAGAKATVVGADAQAVSDGVVVVGTGAYGAGENTLAVGNNASATGAQSLALGANTTVAGRNSTALGADNTVTGDNTFLIGAGNGAVKTSDTGIFGNNNTITDALAGLHVVGNRNTVQGTGATVVGNDNVARGANAVALGNRTSANYANDVALGTGSTTSRTTGTATGVVNGVEHGFAGGTASSTVSVGSAGKERTVSNLGAGRVAADSTDAVNGSQLWATNAELGRGLNVQTDAGKKNIKMGDTISIAGEGANLSTKVDANGTVSIAMAKDLTANSLTTANVVMGPEGVVVSNQATNTKTVVNNQGITVGNVSLTANGLNNGGNKVTNVMAGVASTDAVNMGQLNAAKQELGNRITTNTTNITKLGDRVNTNTTNIANNTTNITKLGDKVNTNTTNITNNTTNITKLGEKVDGHTEDLTKLKKQVSINTSNIETNTTNISNNTKEINNTKVELEKTNTKVETNTREIEKNAGKIADNAAEIAKGMNFAGNTGSVKKALGSTVAIKGAGTKADSNYSAENVKTVVEEDGTLSIRMDKDLKANTVTTTGNASVGGNLSVANNVTVNGVVTGLTNTTWEPTAVVANRAATEGQLKVVSDRVDVNAKAIANNTTNIKKLGDQVNTNTTNITNNTTNITKLGDQVNTNTTNINNLGEKVTVNTEDLSKLKQQVQTNTSNIETNTTDIRNNTTLIQGVKEDLANTQKEVTNNTNEINNTKVELEKTNTKVETNTREIEKNAGKIAENAAEIAKGMKFATNEGEVARQLGDTLTIKGEGQGATTDYSAENIKTVGENGTVKILLSKNLTVDSLQASNGVTAGGVQVGTNGSTVTGLSNTTWDSDHIVSGRAATEDQLKAVETQLSGITTNTETIAKGMNFAGNTGSVKKALGSTVAIKGAGAKADSNYSADNVKTVVEADGTLSIRMDKDLKAESVTGLTNTTWEPTAIVANRAATEGQLKVVSDRVDVNTQAITDLGKRVTTNTTNINNNTTNINNLGEKINVNTEDLSKLKQQVKTNTSNIETNTTDIRNNTTLIQGVKEDLANTQKEVTNNTKEINNTKVELEKTNTKVETNTREIEKHAGKIAENTDKIADNAAEIAKGMNFAGNTGSVKKALGATVAIKGAGTKADSNYSAENVKTVVEEDGTLSIRMDKDLKANTVTTTGNASVGGNLSVANNVTVNGVVTGLTNTTWEPTAVVANRAATEGQLKVVSDRVDVNAKGIMNNTTNITKLGDQVNTNTTNITNNTMNINNLGEKVTVNTEDLSKLKQQVKTNTSNIETNTTDIRNNTTLIQGVKEDLANTQKEVTNNTKEINNTKVELEKTNTKVETNTREIEKNAGKIAENAAEIAKGMKFATNEGEVARQLGDTLTIKGEGQGATTDYSAENIKTVGENGTVKILLSKNLTVDSLQASNGVTAGGVQVGTNGSTVTGLSNTTWDSEHIVSGRAATEDQLQAVEKQLSGISTNAETIAKGMNFAGNTGSVKKALGSTVAIKGAGTKADSNYSAENVKTVVEEDGTLSIRMDKDLKANTVTTTGNAAVGGTLTVGNNVTVNGMVTGLANTTWEPTAVVANRAATEGQLKVVSDRVDVNAEAITKLGDKVNTNTTNIANNTTNITKLGDQVNTNTTNIANNTTNINNLGEKVNVNTEDLSKLKQQVKTNTSNIETNASDIRSNTEKIEANAGKIADNANKIAVNADKIADNATNIEANKGKIAENAAEIAKGMHFAGNTGTVKKALGDTVMIKGGGTKADANYSAANVKTVVEADGTLSIRMDKDLTAETVTTTGNATVGGDLTVANNVSVAGNVQVGGVAIQANGNVTGLTNTTWNPGTAVADRAATEGQLKVVSDRVDANTEAITNLGDRITTNTTNITKLGDQVNVNTTNITNLGEKVNVNTEDLSKLKQQVKTNTSNIETNANDIRSNAEKIEKNTTMIQGVQEDLANTKKDVANNTQEINKTKAELEKTNAKVDSNTRAIEENSGKIAENAGKIAENAGKIAENAGKIADNAANIETNKGKIAENAAEIAKGMHFAGNTGSVKKALGDTVAIKGGGTKADANYSAANVKTVVEADGTLSIRMDKDLTAETVTTTGNASVGGDLTVAKNVSVGGNVQVGGVAIQADGQVTGLTNTTWNMENVVSGRAATEDQLRVVASSVGDNAKAIADNKNAINNNAKAIENNTNYIKNVEVEAKKKTSVVAGANVTVTPSATPNATGGTEYTVELNKSLNDMKAVNFSDNGLGKTAEMTGSALVLTDAQGHTYTASATGAEYVYVPQTVKPKRGKRSLRAAADVPGTIRSGMQAGVHYADNGMMRTTMGADGLRIMDKENPDNVASFTHEGLSLKNEIGSVTITGDKITAMAKDPKDGGVVVSTEGVFAIAKDGTATDYADRTTGTDLLKSENAIGFGPNGITAGNKTIKNVAPGIMGTDAVNVDQLEEVARRIRNMSSEIADSGANAAALSALKPVDYNPDEPTQIMAGYGVYRGKHALALGLAHYTKENVMLNIGAAFTSQHKMVAAGITKRFGHGKTQATRPSVTQLQEEVSTLRKENARIQSEAHAIEDNYRKLRAEHEQMKAQIQQLMAAMQAKA